MSALAKSVGGKAKPSAVEILQDEAGDAGAICRRQKMTSFVLTRLGYLPEPEPINLEAPSCIAGGPQCGFPYCKCKD
jgi:hypothetical protein